MSIIQKLEVNKKYIAIHQLRYHQVTIKSILSPYESMKHQAETILIEVVNQNGESFKVEQDNLFDNVLDAYKKHSRNDYKEDYFIIHDNQVHRVRVNNDKQRITDEDVYDNRYTTNELIQFLNRESLYVTLIDLNKTIAITSEQIFDRSHDANIELINYRIHASKQLTITLIECENMLKFQSMAGLIDYLSRTYSIKEIESILNNQLQDMTVYYQINKE